MSATKPPPGYDDRFVVPLEPSRRGAHRARVSPVIGVLPLVAVVSVVLVVVLLTWMFFVRSPGTSSEAGSTGAPAVTQSVPATQSTPSGSVSTPATSTATSSPTKSGAAGGNVDKAVTVTVLNATARGGLAGKVATLLTGNGWTGAKSAKTPKVTARATTVYYATTSQKAAAEALVTDLGVGVTKKSSTLGTGITVVVGTDYP
jgi:cytoskeletal protein RodZ